MNIEFLRIRVLTNDEHQQAIKQSGFLISLVQNVVGGVASGQAYGVLEQHSIQGNDWQPVKTFIQK